MGNNTRMSRWIFQNAVTGTGNGTEFGVGSNDMTVTIDITGEAGTTGTVYFEGMSSENGDFYPIAAVKSDLSTVATSTSNIGSLWSVCLEGLTKFRVRVGAISGTLSVKGVVTN